MTIPESFDGNSRKPKKMNVAKKNTEEDKDQLLLYILRYRIRSNKNITKNMNLKRKPWAKTMQIGTRESDILQNRKLIVYLANN